MPSCRNTTALSSHANVPMPTENGQSVSNSARVIVRCCFSGMSGTASLIGRGDELQAMHIAAVAKAADPTDARRDDIIILLVGRRPDPGGSRVESGRCRLPMQQ